MPCDINLPKVLDMHAFEDKTGVTGKLVYDLGNVYKEPKVLWSNRSILFRILVEPQQSLYEGSYKGLTVENLEKTLNFIDRVMAPLPREKMSSPDSQQIIDELSNAAALLRHACRMAIARLEADGGRVEDIPTNIRNELTRDLQNIIKEHKRLWLLRNRQGGLSDSVKAMENLLGLYQRNGI